MQIDKFHHRSRERQIWLRYSLSFKEGATNFREISTFSLCYVFSWSTIASIWLEKSRLFWNGKWKNSSLIGDPFTFNFSFQFFMWTSSIFFYHVSFLDQFLSMSVFPLYTFHQAWWPTIMRFYFAFLLGKTTDGSLITRAIAIAVKLKKLAAREIEMLQSWRLAGWCPKHSIK